MVFSLLLGSARRFTRIFVKCPPKWLFSLTVSTSNHSRLPMLRTFLVDWPMNYASRFRVPGRQILVVLHYHDNHFNYNHGWVLLHSEKFGLVRTVLLELQCVEKNCVSNVWFSVRIQDFVFFHGAGHNILNALYFRKNVCNEFSISFNVSCRFKIEYCICPQDYERFFEDGVNGTAKVVNGTGGNATKVLIPNF